MPLEIDVDIDLPKLIWILGITLSVISGGVVVLVRWAYHQFEARLSATHQAQYEQTRQLGMHIDDMANKRELLVSEFRERVGEVEKHQLAKERELMDLRVELAHNYVRREDFVRNQTVIEAKIDGLASKLEVYQLRGGVKHD